jgi:large subunit ribosomal protein L10
MLEGPTAIAFIESGGDPAAVAKALAATAKETNVLTLRGGLLEGRTLTGEEVDRLATLPPLDVLRGQLLGVIVAPLTQLLALVSAPLQNLHGLIDARIEQLEEQGEVATPPAAEVAAAEMPTEEPAPDVEAEADEAAAEIAAEDASGDQQDIEEEPETPAESAPAESADPESEER